jgi:hypothetical protein
VARSREQAAIGAAFAISFVCNTVEVRLVTVGRILGLHTVLPAHHPWQIHLQGLLDWMYAGLEGMRTNIAQVHCTLLTPLDDHAPICRGVRDLLPRYRNRM